MKTRFYCNNEVWNSHVFSVCLLLRWGVWGLENLSGLTKIHPTELEWEPRPRLLVCHCCLLHHTWMWQEYALSVMMNSWKGFIQLGGLLQHCRRWWYSVIPGHQTDQHDDLPEMMPGKVEKGPADQAVLIHFAWNDLFKNNLLLLFSYSVMSDSLKLYGLQNAMLPCPSPSPGACSNSCPLSQWCHPTTSSSVVPFSSCLVSSPASGSFLVS